MSAIFFVIGEKAIEHPDIDMVFDDYIDGSYHLNKHDIQ